MSKSINIYYECFLNNVWTVFDLNKKLASDDYPRASQFIDHDLYSILGEEPQCSISVISQLKGLPDDCDKVLFKFYNNSKSACNFFDPTYVTLKEIYRYIKKYPKYKTYMDNDTLEKRSSLITLSDIFEELVVIKHLNKIVNNSHVRAVIWWDN